MSRQKEALIFNSDDARLEWFYSLTAPEQEEVIIEAQKISYDFTQAFEMIANKGNTLTEAILAWYQSLHPRPKDKIEKA